MDNDDFITSEFLKAIATGTPGAMAAFMARFFPGLTPAAALALVEADSDLSPFEEVAAARWAEHDKREAERGALVLALDAIDHLIGGQDWHYNGYEYQDAIQALYELSLGNRAICQARRALGVLAGHGRPRPARKRLEAARAAVVELLER